MFDGKNRRHFWFTVHVRQGLQLSARYVLLMIGIYEPVQCVLTLLRKLVVQTMMLVAHKKILSVLLRTRTVLGVLSLNFRANRSEA